MACSLALVPAVSRGATVVKFGATLCGNGYVFVGGECRENTRGRCPVGFVQTYINQTTYAGMTFKSQCMNTYTKVPMPDFFYAIYNGVVVKFGPTFCGEKEQMSNGKCVPKVQGRCPDNSYKTVINGNTFSAFSVSSQMCMNSYNEYEMPDFFSALYNGVLVNFGATLCGEGLVSQDGACVARTRGECPEKFYDVTVDEATIVKTEMGACPKDYTVYNFSANCGDGAPGYICAVLCDAGLAYTGVGTCAPRCGAGMGAIRTSTGISIPLYAENQTTPSINVSSDGRSVCYGNLLPGTAAGAINVSRDGKSYHIVD